MNYNELSKETFDLLYKSRETLKNSPVPATILILAELRVSQINGCAYCCRLHSDEARKLGISQQKLDLLPAWHHSKSFSEEERAALEWTEAVTTLFDLEEARTNLQELYSDKQVVDLTACISLMNALNRIATSLLD